MIKILTTTFALIAGCFLLNSCTATPEKYFEVTVLNSNILSGFADDGYIRQLESPSVMMNEKKETVSMTRRQVVAQTIAFDEHVLTEIKALSPTPETKEMIENSKALYEYVLPVYKKEYNDLADQYDRGESPLKIKDAATALHEKYFERYDELYKKLINTGKLYASANDIKVNWNL